MKKTIFVRVGRTLCAGAALFAWGVSPQLANAYTDQYIWDQVRATGVPDYNGSPNWAYSPTDLQKFQDALPLPCNTKGGADIPANVNANGQCITFGVPDTTTYPGSDYYEIEIVQYREQMHSDLDPVVYSDPANPDPRISPTGNAISGGTLLRGYRQINTTNSYAQQPHQMGPVIAAEYNRPVRIKLINKLPTQEAGELFIPVDKTVMGAGPGPLLDWDTDARSPDEVCEQSPELCFSENRTTIHLHGGRSPWISDGTAHQWITPDGEIPANDARDPYYKQGVSVANVPDMWFNENVVVDGLYEAIPSCAGQTYCNVAGATNDPGPGAQTYYWTNTQSARMMFYHEHAWGITRLGVYAGLVAGYFITDDTETALVGAAGELVPPSSRTIPLVLQDKTFVDPATIVDNAATAATNDGTDPTWIWGSDPGQVAPWNLDPDGDGTPAGPVKGDLWWPHVYVPAQDPYNPDLSGTNPFGRWHYGPWFWPPTDVPFGPEANTYYDPNGYETFPQPPEVPGAPHPSWGAEAFLDTPVINGTAYPTLTVQPTTYRFKILNGAHDRFFNLQLYRAVDGYDGAGNDCAGNPLPVGVAVASEVKMIPADGTIGLPGNSQGTPDFAWPSDGREGGVPDPANRGPAFVQIGTDGGFLPRPVVLPNRPVNWETDPTLFVAGLVRQQNQGGGTLMMGPAERADVIVDFSQFEGQTLILYNDAPAPWPALDPHYDYYTCDADQTEIGGTVPTQPGFGPNTRTLMQIVVADDGNAATTPSLEPNAVPANLGDLETAFLPTASGGMGIFDEGQEPIIVGQDAYDANYVGVDFPNTFPTWGLSRITDTSISFVTPDGATVNAYPMEPKAIQDEMGETFDDFGRMSANLGLEMGQTTAGIQTFILQNFVDPPTEVIAQDQVQIWKITHNGVDTHPVHFHLFEVQLLNRVGWDGFIYLPDPNEIGWKDTIRISPLEDTIVALRPVHVPTPFEVPNSIRPLNPATKLGNEFGFTGIDPFTGQARTTPVVNEVLNMGHEYLWHCHILSHEEQDMMRVIVLNQDSLLFTQNTGDGFWQWKRGDWSQISDADPEAIVSSGPFSYADFGTDGLWQWNGYDWRKITVLDASVMYAHDTALYAYFPGSGYYKWHAGAWTKLSGLAPETMVATDAGLYTDFGTNGVWFFNGTSWTKISGLNADNLVASSTGMYGDFGSNGLWSWNGSAWTKLSFLNPDSLVAFQAGLDTNFGLGLYGDFGSNGMWKWDGNSWTKISGLNSSEMVATDANLYAQFPGQGLWKWNGGSWKKISFLNPLNMAASPSILFGNFAGDTWKYEHGSWIQLMNSSPVDTMAAGF